MYETETDSQTREQTGCLPRGRGAGEGRIRILGVAEANYYIEDE